MRRPFREDAFWTENLYYNAADDYFVCPMGQHMRHCSTVHDRTAIGYPTVTARYRAAPFEGCPLRGQCFKTQRGNRTIEVNHRLWEYKGKAHERLTSKEGLMYRSRRPVGPEAVFGRMKHNMGYKHFRHFGLEKVRMDFTSFAIAFNLKKMRVKMNGTYGKSLEMHRKHCLGTHPATEWAWNCHSYD